jgi:AcrR family transcriptional regulator
MSKKVSSQDPRIVRTHQLLRHALIELMSERIYSSITIQDITARATLNRATFYLHYRDKGELLQDVLDEMVKNTPLTPNQNESSLSAYTFKAIAALFVQFGANAGFYRALLSGENVPTFNQLVHKYIQDIGLRWIALLQPDRTKITLQPEFIIHYIGSAFLGVVNWWLENDMPYSAEQMAYQLIQLTTLGLDHSLGISIPENYGATLPGVPASPDLPGEQL